jgi:predicted nucleotidyltransferase component of viral defense system
MIKEWLETYNPGNPEEVQHALREIMQETALAGLYRSGFFEKAAFYGGTALRIFHGLPRFSEDLDFTLLERGDGDTLSSHLAAVKSECEAIGFRVEIAQKKKTSTTSIDSAFLKSETSLHELTVSIAEIERFNSKIRLKVKLEVDTIPPGGFNTEEKLLLRPFSCFIKCVSLPDLFAGKMHALLYRKWKSRAKGRDWYDLEWYIRNGHNMHLVHFNQRAIQCGDLQKPCKAQSFRKLLNERIESVDIDQIRDDASRFIKNPKELEIWSREYFHTLSSKMKID